MSTETESLLQVSLGNKPYCTRKQLVALALEIGLCGSPSGAFSALKSLPWIKVSPKRTVVPRDAALEYFRGHAQAHDDTV